MIASLGRMETKEMIVQETYVLTSQSVSHIKNTHVPRTASQE